VVGKQKRKMSRNSLPALVVAGLLTASAAAQNNASPAPHIAVNIDASKPRDPISPYIYGQFIEHIGDLVNRSLWAEMLDDRKFYYPIRAENPTPQPPPSGPFRARRHNRWLPIGPDSAVVMDRDHPFMNLLFRQVIEAAVMRAWPAGISAE
jgi:alpha-N-arabinofuranosidase